MPTLITFLIGIAFLSLCPQSVPVGEIPDWLGHALAYGSLTAFAQMNWPARSVAIAIAIFALGLAIELAQGFTPDRSVSVDDLIANTVGIAVVGSRARRLYLWHIGSRRVRRDAYTRKYPKCR